VNGLLTPARRRGVEILDDPSIDPELMRRGMKDVARANLVFGGLHAAMSELEPAIAELAKSGTLLDVGPGHGDISAAARRTAGARGTDLRTIGIDMASSIVTAKREENELGVRGDALALPFRDRSIDIVFASQLMHHFPRDSAVALAMEMNRVARQRVVISDLRRSFVAAAGFWIGSFPLGFHPVSRHDGVVSVMRGFTAMELADIAEAATGFRPQVVRRLGFRLTTSWKPR
jgi:SAM-dependent methyltransferase